jgi:hypothetical protein
LPKHLERYGKYLYPYRHIQITRSRKVTACIGIACDSIAGRSKIVLISDRQLHFGGTSTETGLKTMSLCSNWRALFAGDDISMVMPVISAASFKLRNGSNQQWSEVSAAMLEAFQAVRRRQIESTYLSSWGWTVEEFLKKGKVALPENHFQNLIYDIERFDLGCQFLACGLTDVFPDSDAILSFPSMFYIHNPGVLIPVDDSLGYGAVGSGATLAIAYLAQRMQKPTLSLEESVYNGIVAKRLAERSMGVGQDTIVEIMRPKNREQILDAEKIGAISTIWKDEEANIRPKNLVQRMSEIINS